VNVAEATRQYQATLEARRTLRHATEGTVTFDEEQRSANADVEQAERDMFSAWAGRLVEVDS
jgi:hypothetical protein